MTVRVSQGQALSRLKASWGDTSEPPPRLTLLTGAGGIGKSWTLARWREGQGRLVPLLDRPPLLANLLRAARPLLSSDHNRDFLAAAQQILPEGSWPQAVAGTTALSQETLELQLAQALMRAAARLGGVAIAIDGLEAWSPTDLSALRRLVRMFALAKAPVHVIACTRRVDREWWDDLRRDFQALAEPEPVPLELLPNDLAETAAVAESFLSTRALPDELPPWLQRRSGGVPLHTLELLRYLVQGGALTLANTTWTFTPPASEHLPTSLTALAAERLANAAALPGKELLHCLALLDREAPAAELGQLVDLPPGVVESSCRSLEAAALVVGRLRAGHVSYGLASPALAPLLLRELSSRALQEWHLLIAERSSDPYLRARHARQAGHPRASELTRAAARTAFAQGNHEELRRHAEALLPAAKGAEESQLRYWCGLAALSAGEPAEAAAQLRRSAEPAARELLVTSLARQARFEEALAEAGATLARLNPEEVPYVAARQVGLLLALGRIEEASDLLDRRLASAGSGRLRGELLIEKARLCERRRDPSAQQEAALAAVAEFRADGAPVNRIAWSFAGTAARNLKDPVRAREYLNNYVEDAKAHGDLPALSSAYSNLGAVAIDEEDPRAAAGHLRAAARIATSGGQRFEEAQARANLACACLDLGDHEGAIVNAERALELHEQLGMVHFTPFELSLLAFAHAMAGAAEAARSRLGELAGKPPAFVNPGWTAGAWLLLRNAEEARGALDRGPAPSEALAGLWSGLIDLVGGRHEQAAAALRAAASRAQEQRLPLTGDQANLALAVIAAASGDAAAAGDGRRHLARLQSAGGTGRIRLLELLFPKEMARLRQAPASAAPVSIFIRAFGGLELERDGVVVPWKGRKPRELLGHLLVAELTNRGPIRREELTAQLWPDAGEAQAATALRVTLQRLRRALGSPDSVVRTGDGRFRLGEIASDVGMFLTALARNDLEAALGWYRSGLLLGVAVPGTEGVREHLLRRFGQAVHRLAVEAPPQRAAELFDRALEEDAFDLAALLGLVAALDELGDRGSARRHLLKYVQLYRDELGEVPAELEVLVKRTASSPYY